MTRARTVASEIKESLVLRLRWDELTSVFSATALPGGAEGGLERWEEATPGILDALSELGLDVYPHAVSLSVSAEDALLRHRGPVPFESAAFSLSRDGGDHLALGEAIDLLAGAGVVIDVVNASRMSSDLITARGAIRTLLRDGGVEGLVAVLSRVRGRSGGAIRATAILVGAKIHGDIFDIEVGPSGSVISMTARSRDLRDAPPTLPFDEAAVAAADALAIGEAAGSRDPAILHTLACSPDIARRLAAARSPWSAPETLEMLVVDRETEVRDAAIMNPGIPRRALWKMGHDPHYAKNREAAARRHDIPDGLAEILAGDGDRDVRRALASNTSVPYETVAGLVWDVDMDVARAALGRPDVPPETVMAVALGKSERALLVMGRDDLPLEIVERRLAETGDREMKIAAAARRTLPRRLIRGLASDLSPDVRLAVLRAAPHYADGAAAAEILPALAADGDAAIRLELLDMRARHRAFLAPHLPGLTAMAAADGDYEVRARLAALDEDLPTGILNRLAGDSSTAVVTAVLGRGSIPQETHEIAAANEHMRREPTVKAMVERSLRARKLAPFLERGEGDAVSALRAIGLPGRVASRLLAEAREKGLDTHWFIDAAPVAAGLRYGPTGEVAEVDHINAVNNLVTRAAESGAVKDALKQVSTSGYGEEFGRLLGHIPPQKRLRVIESGDGASPAMVRDMVGMFFGRTDLGEDGTGGGTEGDDRPRREVVLEYVREAGGKEIAGLAAFHKFLERLASRLRQPNLKLRPDAAYDLEGFQGTLIHSKKLGDLKVHFPRSAHELIDWGETLGICVGNGGYARSAAEGGILLVALRAAQGGRMVGMVEARRPSLEIVQAKGHGNANLPEDVKTQLRGILARLRGTKPKPKPAKDAPGKGEGTAAGDAGAAAQVQRGA